MASNRHFTCKIKHVTYNIFLSDKNETFKDIKYNIQLDYVDLTISNILCIWFLWEYSEYTSPHYENVVLSVARPGTSHDNTEERARIQMPATMHWNSMYCTFQTICSAWNKEVQCNFQNTVIDIRKQVRKTFIFLPKRCWLLIFSSMKNLHIISGPNYLILHTSKNYSDGRNNNIFES